MSKNIIKNLKSAHENPPNIASFFLKIELVLLDF
jgi:hypothetical protein